MGPTRSTGSTRERIVETAVDQFHRRGYDATSLRQIADAVGVQVGSLYNHLHSKEELLHRIVRGTAEELARQTAESVEAAGADPVDRVRAFLAATVRFHATRPREAVIAQIEVRGLTAPHRAEVVALADHQRRILQDALAAAHGAGRMSVPDPELAARAALPLCRSVAEWWRPGGGRSLSDVVRDLPAMFAPLAVCDPRDAASAAI